MPALVLGSGSPRRRSLLEGLGLRLIVRVPDVNEEELVHESAEGYLVRVVDAKYEAARALMIDSDPPWLLVADTIVTQGGALLGKPRDPLENQSFLERLAGRTHLVRTRFALGSTSSEALPPFAETVETQVTFRSISVDEQRAYVASGEGHDKAGGYAIQGAAAHFVESIAGSRTNVVGLPIEAVEQALRRVGIMK